MSQVVYVWSTLKSKLNYWGLSDQVWFVMKIKQDNDLINHIGMVYTKNETKML